MAQTALIVGYNEIGRIICDSLINSNDTLKIYGILDEKLINVQNDFSTFNTPSDLPRLSDDVLFLALPDVIILANTNIDLSDYAKEYNIPICYVNNNLEITDVSDIALHTINQAKNLINKIA